MVYHYEWKNDKNMEKFSKSTTILFIIMVLLRKSGIPLRNYNESGIQKKGGKPSFCTKIISKKITMSAWRE